MILLKLTIGLLILFVSLYSALLKFKEYYDKQRFIDDMKFTIDYFECRMSSLSAKYKDVSFDKNNIFVKMFEDYLNECTCIENSFYKKLMDDFSECIQSETKEVCRKRLSVLKKTIECEGERLMLEKATTLRTSTLSGVLISLGVIIIFM